ncbi:type VI secretion system baseplate subunit TssE [Sphingomonas sp. 1P06PA]|uniref:type VI secretion system baseplate subunit TssE n=1 Tax=Sphingomonas sp. 1P06PA TaxID=554121 RepID=UPI0039A63F02
MAIGQRLNPTLFDKLVGGLEVEGLIEDGRATTESSRETMRNYAIPRIERFNEEALRATVRREIAWLLNTTNLAAIVDLEPYPQVQTSVLNFGVPDLAGKSLSRRVILQRAREIRAAIRAFEPRMDESSLVVEPVVERERENAITYVIHGDVRSAVQALPVKFRTDIESDTAAVTVRE